MTGEFAGVAGTLAIGNCHSTPLSTYSVALEHATHSNHGPNVTVLKKDTRLDSNMLGLVDGSRAHNITSRGNRVCFQNDVMLDI